MAIYVYMEGKVHLWHSVLHLWDPCNQYDKTFTLQGVLRRHQVSVHKGFKYPCAQCDKTFSHQGNLNSHKMSANEGVKYPCNPCNRKFTSKGNLKKHKISTLRG